MERAICSRATPVTTLYLSNSVLRSVQETLSQGSRESDARVRKRREGYEDTLDDG